MFRSLSDVFEWKFFSFSLIYLFVFLLPCLFIYLLSLTQNGNLHGYLSRLSCLLVLLLWMRLFLTEEPEPPSNFGSFFVDLWPLPLHRCVRLTPTWSRLSSTGPGDWVALAMARLGPCRPGVRCGRGFWTSCWTGPTTTYCGNSVESLLSLCRKTSSHCRWN